MFSKMPFILALIILSIILLDSAIPFAIKQFLYTLSLSIKTIIVFVLPFIIFSLLFKTAVSLQSKGTNFILIILLAACCSNFISTFLSHYVGMWIFNFNLSLILPKESNTLEPLWTLEPIPLITNSQAMFLGLILGIVAAKFKPNEANIIAEKLKIFVDKILYVLIFIIPLFVIGFIIKLQYDGSLQMIAKDYTSIFIIVALAQSSYILFLYFILSNYKIKDCLYNLKNMLPAALAGFSTMSSAASIPMTIIGTESNLKNKSLASSIIPITVNIHLIGDCFAIPIFAYAILRNYGISEPSLINYLIFTFYFILAKFSIAAVPGGGIIVMLPILEHYLGFNAEMMSLITALYILFDPVVTCTNVLGNGALTKLIDKIYTR